MVLFVTSNHVKFKEAKQILGKIEQTVLEIPEPRGNLIDVSRFKALYAYSLLHKPLFVDDSGIFIDALNGFPGIYSKYVYNTIGLEGILKLLKYKSNRSCKMISAITYVDEKNVKTFLGVVEGTISYEIKTGGFAYDNIFIPNGFNLTFSENKELKLKISHRTRALIQLRDFLQNNKSF